MKIGYYVVLACTLMLLFYVAGFDTTSSTVISKLDLLNLKSTDVAPTVTATQAAGDSSRFSVWQILAIIFGVGAIATVAIGLLTGGVQTFTIVGAFLMIPLVLIAADFIWILNQLDSGSWMYYVALLFIAPLIGGYVIELINYWRGTN